MRFIHTKIIFVDPLTDTPTVVTGSANYSGNSSTDNEENSIVLRGDGSGVAKRVADIYLTEYQRLFMHFVFRSWANQDPSGESAAGRLAEDDSWSRPTTNQAAGAIVSAEPSRAPSSERERARYTNGSVSSTHTPSLLRSPKRPRPHGFAKAAHSGVAPIPQDAPRPWPYRPAPMPRVHARMLRRHPAFGSGRTGPST